MWVERGERREERGERFEVDLVFLSFRLFIVGTVVAADDAF